MPPLTWEERFWVDMKLSFDGEPEARLLACVRDDDMSSLQELLPLCGTGELKFNYCDI